MVFEIKHTLPLCQIVFLYFRTPKDFASASDKIWPHFAALGLERTHRYELVDKGVIRKVM